MDNTYELARPANNVPPSPVVCTSKDPLPSLTVADVTQYIIINCSTTIQRHYQNIGMTQIQHEDALKELLKCIIPDNAPTSKFLVEWTGWSEEWLIRFVRRAVVKRLLEEKAFTNTSEASYQPTSNIVSIGDLLSSLPTVLPIIREDDIVFKPRGAVEPTVRQNQQCHTNVLTYWERRSQVDESDLSDSDSDGGAPI